MFKILLYLTFWLLGSAVKDVTGQVTQPPCNLACTFIYRPVCASNGLTYANICTMESISCIDGLGLTLRHEGPCI